jgi:uncharacterized Zn finger protein
MVLQHVSSQSFERGKRYYNQGNVGSVVRRGRSLIGEVWGSQYDPYRVEVTFDDAGITGAFCSCPYDWGGWCKHIVAVLLTLIQEEERVEERPTVDALLAELDAAQLRAVLKALIANDVTLITKIETVAAQWADDEVGPSGASKRDVDLAAFRQRVRWILHSTDGMRPSEAYWHVGEIVGELEDVLAEAEELIEADNADLALPLLEVLTEEYVEGWLGLDDSDGFAGQFFYSLGRAWTEALLSVELSVEEREAWKEKIQRWDREVDQYGIVDAFLPALVVLEEYPDVTEISYLLDVEGLEEEMGAWYRSELLPVALRVLERQERYDLYLELARGTLREAAYVTTLVKLERIDEAVAYGMQEVRNPSAVLALAKALRVKGYLTEALRLGEHGLTLERPKGDLAAWLRDAAVGLERTDLALRAAKIAFREHPDLNAYLQVRELAGETWPTVREELLDALRARSSDGSPAVVEVFLHAGEIDDAIRALGQYPGDALVAQVANAAAPHRPDWVIRQCRTRAERIMDAGQSGRYNQAANWLAKVKAAYLAKEEPEAWRAYLSTLLDKHYRKYKLVPMLENLRT